MSILEILRQNQSKKETKMKINILNYTTAQFDQECLRQIETISNHFEWEGDYDIVTIDGCIAIIHMMTPCNDITEFETELFDRQPELAPYISYHMDPQFNAMLVVKLNEEAIERDGVEIVIKNFGEK